MINCYALIDVLINLLVIYIIKTKTHLENKIGNINSRDKTMNELEGTCSVCAYCWEHFTSESGEIDAYCSFAHRHLDNVGNVKNQIESWFRWEYPLFKIMGLFNVCFGQYMTYSSAERWKRAIVARYELSK